MRLFYSANDSESVIGACGGKKFNLYCGMRGSKTDRRSLTMANTAESGILSMSVPRPLAVFSYIMHCRIDRLHQFPMKIGELDIMGRNIDPYWNSKLTQPA